jgi:hypothetical protein
MVDCATKLRGDTRGRFIDNPVEENDAINEIAPKALRHFESTQKLGVIRSPVFGFFLGLVEFALGLIEGRLWIDWPAARATLCGSHFAP